MHLRGTCRKQGEKKYSLSKILPLEDIPDDHRYFAFPIHPLELVNSWSKADRIYLMKNLMVKPLLPPVSQDLLTDLWRIHTDAYHISLLLHHDLPFLTTIIIVLLCHLTTRQATLTMHQHHAWPAVCAGRCTSVQDGHTGASNFYPDSTLGENTPCRITLILIWKTKRH